MAREGATVERADAQGEHEGGARSCTKAAEREAAVSATACSESAKELRERKRAQGKSQSICEHNVELGRRGEEAAARFLHRRGYEIIARNWICAAGEADIVARDDDAVVFVEVKTRSNCDHGMPSEAVDAAKRDRYERIAALYLKDYDVVDVPVRFDIVSIVVIAPDRAMIRHHINAFAAG